MILESNWMIIAIVLGKCIETHTETEKGLYSNSPAEFRAASKSTTRPVTAVAANLPKIFFFLFFLSNKKKKWL